MKLLDGARHSRDWKAAEQQDGLFYLDRSPVLSPAAAAQDSANQSRTLRRWGVMWQPWEYSGWIKEGRSFHDAAYLGDWTALDKVRVIGPDALRFFDEIGTNDLSKFGINRMKHHVEVNDEGFIASQGVLYRLAEHEFIYTGVTSPRAYYLAKEGKWDVEAEFVSADVFLFSIQGPKSLEIVQDAFGGDWREIKFNQFTTFTWEGAELRLLRTGVSGTLGYEIHGPSSHGNAVWARLVEIGNERGLRELGLRAQLLSHIEAGIATNGLDFLTVPTTFAGKPQFVGMGPSNLTPIGSHRIASDRELYRTPAELNWVTQVSLDSHDFIGRDALIRQRDAGGPERRLLGLVWNEDDVVSVFRSLFGEAPLMPMEMPRFVGIEINTVFADGREVGTTTSRIYSPFMRKMISLGHVDRSVEAGQSVTVLWGEPGGNQAEVRADVVALPFQRDGRRDAT